MRYSIIAALALAVMSCAAPAYSHRWGGVSVEVVSDRGSRFETIPFKEFSQGGTRMVKRYLEARRGENYEIVIRNNMSERVGVVIAVDGRNIISGGRSYLNSSEQMYIVNSHEETRLQGWRTDSSSVHRFYFTDVQDSYAMKTFSDGSAMGVIAVAVFREKDRPLARHDLDFRQEAAPPAPAAAEKRRAGEAAGTGFGDRTHSPVVQVAFEAETRPMEKVLIKYEWHEVLCKKGIIACGPDRRNRLWDENAFAPYPPGYLR